MDPLDNAAGKAGKASKAGKESNEGTERIKELEGQIAKLTDLAARAQADLQNSKIRMEREAEDLRKFAIVPLLLALLPVRDDLARAASQGDEGVKQILEKIDKVFSTVGLKRMEPLGKPVDPTKHEILNVGPGEKDVVTLVHEDGYELHGRVLRAAKVQVGDGKTSES
jgi:molecular chaperone GrpE